jgi:intracellular sulfur oxidation DsrE/DsrF family protein
VNSRQLQLQAGDEMKTAAFALVAVLVLASGSFGPANAAGEKPLLVPGYEAAKDLPGARELPDPKTDYKVVFADNQDAKNPGDVNPMLPTIATYVNTLGKYGVPSEHRHLVIMFHHRTPDADIVMSNEAYRERYGRDNPNIAIIHALKQAGVDLRVCGQGILARKIDPKQVNPDISIDLWAMTTLVNLQLKGYVRVG